MGDVPKQIASFVYEELRVGQQVTFQHIFSPEDCRLFSTLSGDKNPLHLDDTFAQEQGFPTAIVQGLLVQSLFSRLAGMHLPGKYSLILSLESQFRKPVLPHQPLLVEAVLASKLDALKIITLELVVKSEGGETLVTGVMKVKVLR